MVWIPWLLPNWPTLRKESKRESRAVARKEDSPDGLQEGSSNLSATHRCLAVRRGPRIALQVLLVLVGLAAAVFFYLLFAIADCSDACQAAGERAGATVPAALGVGVVMAGALLARGWRMAAGGGLAFAGVLAAGASAVLLATGEGGWHTQALVGGLAALAVGVWMFWRA